jgi:hypothetical protein
VFLIPLGLPWIYLVDVLPDALRPWAAALAPLVNWLLIGLVCAAGRTRRG